MTIIGVDFGNQFTKIYKISNGKPEIVFNEQSNRKIYSHLVFRDETRYFGQDAFDRSSKSFSTCLYHLRGWLSGTNGILDVYNYQKSNSDLLKHVPELDKTHILAIFFSYLKQLVGQKCLECVISFERGISRELSSVFAEACQISGIYLIGLIDDGVACAMDYGFKGLLQGVYSPKDGDTEKTKTSETVCFLDGGHGTLKMTIVEYHHNNLKVMTTATTGKISGHLLTLELLKQCQEDIMKRYQFKLELYPKYNMGLYQACERAKISLSVNSSTVINYDFYLNGRDINYSYTLTQEMLTQVMTDWKTIFGDFVKDKILSQQLSLENIDKVILTGGNIRVPYFRQVINSYFTNPVETTLNIDESVARGCCLIGALHSDTISTKAKINLEYHSREEVKISWTGKPAFSLIKRGSIFPTTKKVTIRDVRDLNILVSYNGKTFQELVHVKIPGDISLEKQDNLEVYIEYGLNEICRVKSIILAQTVLEQIVVKDKDKDKDKDKGNDKDKGKEAREEKDSNPSTFEKSTQTQEVGETREKIIKTPIKFTKLEKPVSSLVTKLQSFEKQAEDVRQRQLRKEILTNSLETDYYAFQDKLTSDTCFREYLSELEQRQQLHLVEKRLELLYQNEKTLEELETYCQELRVFDNKIQRRIKNDEKLREAIGELKEKYKFYYKKLQHKTSNPNLENYKHYFHSFAKQVDEDWLWFQEVMTHQQTLHKWQDPIITAEELKAKLETLEKMYQEAESNLDLANNREKDSRKLEDKGKS